MELDASSSSGQRLGSWIRVDAATGDSQVIEVEKFSMMERCHLSAGDVRYLDPLRHSTILSRERAIIVNLEQILRCIITSDEVVLPNSGDSHVSQYVVELQQRLKDDYLHFEFKALEVALLATRTFFRVQRKELKNEARPLLDELKSKISTSNFERVCKLRSKLVALTQKVEKERDLVKQILGDDGKMAEMYQSIRPENMNKLENLLESCLLDAIRTLDKLTSRKESIDDAEYFIKFQLEIS